MNFSYFISRRIGKQTEGAFSTIINRIAVVSVAIGLAVLLLSFLILLGFKKEIKEKIYGFSGHLIVSKYSLSTSFEESAISISDSLRQELADFPHTRHFQSYAFKAALLKTEDVQGVLFKGIDHDFDTVNFKKHLLEGRFPTFKDKGYTTEFMPSRKIANYLNLKVGDTPLAFFVQNPPRYRKMKVVGIYETGLEEFDDRIVMGDIGLIQKLNEWNDTIVGGIEVYINDLDKLEEAEYALFNTLDVDLYVDKVTDKYVQIFEWLKLLDRNVLILMVIIAVVCGTSIISIMLILIMERTQMIGVLKSIGATNALIRKIFIWNGLLLIFKGLAWGNVVGLGIGVIQYYFKIIPLDQTNYYMAHVPISFDFTTIIAINLGILAVISLTLFIPVNFISRIQPVKAIRFD